MTINEIKSAIAKETSFIDNKIKVIEELKRYYGTGVRSASASADIGMEAAMLQTAIATRKNFEQLLKEMTNES
jgi:hypothetical protein